MPVNGETLFLHRNLVQFYYHPVSVFLVVHPRPGSKFLPPGRLLPLVPTRRAEVFRTVFKSGDGVLFIVVFPVLSQGLAHGQTLVHTA